MSLTTRSVHVSPGRTTLEFELTHSTPGRDGTILSEPLTLRVSDGHCECELHVTDCKGTTPDETLTRMASWLRRLADGIEERKPSKLIPL